MSAPGDNETQVIKAMATVTLDARALDELGPAAIDRIADLVAARLAERKEAGERPYLSAREAAKLAGVHTETIRRAIRSGALPIAGYAGQRPRLRQEDVEEWLRASASNEPGVRVVRRGPSMPTRPSRAVRSQPGSGVLGEALRTLGSRS